MSHLDSALAWEPCPFMEAAVPAFLKAATQFPEDYPDLDVEDGCVWSALPFYRHFRLFEFKVSGFAHEKPLVYGLGTATEAHWLGGSADPIKRANRLEKLDLPESLVLPYLSFYLFFSRGERGGYRLIESPLLLAPNDMPETELAVLATTDAAARERLTRLRLAQSVARPLEMGVLDGGARYGVRGAIVYGDQLLNGVFVVERDGDVTLVADPEVLDLRGLEADDYQPIRLHDR